MGWSTYQPQLLSRILAINRMSRNLVFCLIFFNDGSFSRLERHSHDLLYLDVTLRMKKLWICVKSQKKQVCKWWHRPLFFGTCYIWIYSFQLVETRNQHRFISCFWRCHPRIVNLKSEGPSKSHWFLLKMTVNKAVFFFKLERYVGIHKAELSWIFLALHFDNLMILCFVGLAL